MTAALARLEARLARAWAAVASRRAGPDAAALGALAVVALAFFAPVWLGPYRLPQGGGDLASFLFPMYRFVAESYRAGEIPLWNPHQYAGAPLAADNQSGMFYPPLALLFLAWPRFPYAALEGMAMLHVWGAGALTYLALRLWRPTAPVHRAAAVLGGIAYMLGDVLVTHLGNLNFDAVAAWIPLALVCQHRACGAPDGRAALRWSLAGGLVVGTAALAGHAQVSVFTAGLLALYALYRAFTDRGPRPVLALLGIGLVAAGLAAVAWLPARELTGLSARADYAYETTLEYSLPPEGLIGLALPGAFGRGAAAFRGGWDRVEIGYAGVLTWLLALVALWLAAAPGRAGARAWLPAGFRRDLAFLGGAGALFLALALGPATPLHRWLLGPLELPFRAPARYLLLLDLCLALAAAFGLDALLRRSGPRGPRIAPAIAAFVALGAAAVGAALVLAPGGGLGGPSESPPWSWLSVLQAGRGIPAFLVLAAASLGLAIAYVRGGPGRRSLALACCLLLAIDLVALGAMVEVDPGDPVAGFQREEAAAWLRARNGLARIDNAAGAWQPGAAQLHGLQDIGGVYNPLRLGTYGYYMDGLRRRGSTPFDLLGARFVLADKGQAPADDAAFELAYEGDPAVDVWRNQEALPRAWLVDGVRIAPDDGAAYETLHDPGFDPRRELVLGAEEAARLGGVAARPPGGQARGEALGEVELLAYAPDEIRLRVAAAAPAWLVLSEIYHPRWEARLDGAPLEIARANFALRALRVPEGESELVLRFRPPSWPRGLALTGLTLGLAALLLFATREGAPGLAALRRRLYRRRPDERGPDSRAEGDR